jgi:hypothetical protein
MNNYYRLGKLPLDDIDFLKTEILKTVNLEKQFQWVQLSTTVLDYFDYLFENDRLKIQCYSINGELKRVQKAFYSETGNGFRIHKDGLMCKSAMNIAISCNSEDWVRWYDDDYINSLNPEKRILNQEEKKSRDIEIMDYETVPFIQEVHNEEGDVYIVNTDVYHSYKCLGPKPRIVLQTKFTDFPDIETAFRLLKSKSFKRLIR